MARVALFVPDLLFGSNVLGAMRSAGHEAVLVSELAELDPDAADLLVVDLTLDAPARVQLATGPPFERLPKLAFYAHVEADVRELAQRAGFDLVVPRSRMAREGPQLVARLTG